jgi:acyl-homoserine-lactone acylase
MGMDLRPQRAVNLIKDDPSISFQELVDYKLNTGMEAADRFLDDLAEAVKQYPDTLAQKAIAVLKAWDRTTNADSHGAVLFSSWCDLLDGTMFLTPWTYDHPVTTPDGLKDPRKAVTLLANAAKEVQKAYGSLDIAWGEVNRFRVGNNELPANGGPGHFGIFRTMYFSKDKSTKKGYAYHGDSYVAVTEFGKKVRAMVLLSYGNASQPGNKHIGDQLQLLSQKKLRPALLEKREVLSQLEKRELLNSATPKF